VIAALRARWRRATHSLRARLVALFLLLALATAAVFLFGMQRWLQGGWQGWVQPLAADYVDRLAAEIGSPPDAARAQALAARLPIRVRIDGPRLQFDSHPGHHDDGDDDGSRARGDRSPPWAQWLQRQTADGHRIRFTLAAPLAEVDRPRRLGWVTLTALMLLTAIAWAVVQRLLRPLQPIGDGVARFGRGDFSQPIALARDDELGQLADRIDGMARNLQGMLEHQRGLLLAISHELRSPLTRARLNAELVDEGPARDALLRDLAEMRDLIETLLESERIAAGAQALQLERVDLPALVHELVDTRFAGRGITLALQPPPGPVLADAARLRLLLRNLLDNALRHGAGAPQPPQVFLHAEPDSRWALGVRDHGPGLPPGQLAALGQPFHRPDSARTRAAGGVGLGLYLCRLVAQAHGGELRLRDAAPGLEVAMVWPVADLDR
jgi:signal transduction histidine kinase